MSPLLSLCILEFASFPSTIFLDFSLFSSTFFNVLLDIDYGVMVTLLIIFGICSFVAILIFLFLTLLFIKVTVCALTEHFARFPRFFCFSLSCTGIFMMFSTSSGSVITILCFYICCMESKFSVVFTKLILSFHGIF